jgi:hypothetical protein
MLQQFEVFDYRALLVFKSYTPSYKILEGAYFHSVDQGLEPFPSKQIPRRVATSAAQECRTRCARGPPRPDLEYFSLQNLL